MEVSDCSYSDELCIMNEAVIMIAEHFETENSPVAELQDFPTFRVGMMLVERKVMLISHEK